MIYKKGIEYERKLVRYLNKLGFMAVRTAGSGGGTPEPRPDVLAGNNKQIYSIEVKSSSKDMVYLKNKEVYELKEFANGFGAIPLICVKFPYMDFFFINPKRLIHCKTKGGNFKITREFVEFNKNKVNDLV